MEDWSELLPELVTEIAEKIILCQDFMSFADVCASWRAAAAAAVSSYPSLMLAPEKMTLTEDENKKEKDTEEEEERRFFLLSNNIRNIKVPSEIRHMQCLSSRGWLLTMAKHNPTAKLVHPLSGRQINLPNLTDFQDRERRYFPIKFVLSSDFSVPSPNDFLVTVCLGSLWLWRAGDANWTHVTSGIVRFQQDITYHNGMVYAVDIFCRVQSCDVHGIINHNPTSLEVKQVPEIPQHYGVFHRLTKMVYIVELDEKLMIVIRGRDYKEWEAKYKDYVNTNLGTTCFHIYQFNLITNEWSKVNDLGNLALFLGSNSSFLREASDSESGCIIKGNCIYYTDNVYDTSASREGREGSDMGIYHLSDGSIEPHFTGESLSRNSPPMWIEPNFNVTPP